jgi:N-acetylmuramoyl-L-alanine amidase
MNLATTADRPVLVSVATFFNAPFRRGHHRLVSFALRLPILLLSLACLPACMSVKVPRVAVDVGHGRLDGGAVSARGRPEFEFNRMLALKVAGALRARHLTVREINFDGAIASLAERPAQAAGGDLFLSIHHDSIDPDYLLPWEWHGAPASYTEAKRGFGLFIAAGNAYPEASLRCASDLGAHLRRTGFEPTPWHRRKHAPADAENGVWYYDTLLVLHRTDQPAILFEAGVIKHREEELELLDIERQGRMAEALADGVAACLTPGRHAGDGASLQTERLH